MNSSVSCSEYQRYQLLRAIHNKQHKAQISRNVVPNIKDINFWEQFTTPKRIKSVKTQLFRISKISTFESNSQHSFHCLFIGSVVPNIKDINFWEQFTTKPSVHIIIPRLFRISKISTFESNSQRRGYNGSAAIGCSEYQRYQLLRAIHNGRSSCVNPVVVVPNIKDINFWEQFTTVGNYTLEMIQLFRISKISTFESNSQRKVLHNSNLICCSEYQRYQLLRAIHNGKPGWFVSEFVVPNIKDINFWEQFTTGIPMVTDYDLLFRISKISTFESNSQLKSIDNYYAYGCSEYQRYQLLRAIHNYWFVKKNGT